jgi:hypothetical protein
MCRARKQITQFDGIQEAGGRWIKDKSQLITEWFGDFV